MGLEKTPESPLDSKDIKLVNLKGNQPLILIGRTGAEVEISIFWSSDVDSWLIGKFPDAGKDWEQKEKRVSEDEMAEWHHQCYGHELGQTSRDSEDKEAWCAAVHGVTKSGTRLGDWTTAIVHCVDLYLLLFICCYVYTHTHISLSISLSIYTYIFIHSSFKGYLGCFHILQ